MIRGEECVAESVGSALSLLAFCGTGQEVSLVICYTPSKFNSSLNEKALSGTYVKFSLVIEHL